MRRRDLPPATQGPVRLVWPLVRSQRGRIFAIAFLSVLGSLAEATVLVLIAQVAVELAGGGDTLHMGLGPLGSYDVAIGTALVVGVVLLVFRVAAQIGAARFAATATSEVRKRLRTDLMSEYLGASWQLQSDERAGRLQELGTTFVGSTAQTVFTFTQLLIAVCSLTIFVVTAFAVNAIAAVSVAVAALGMGMLLRPLRHRVKRLSRLSSLANLRYATDVSEVATTMQEIRVFDVEHQVQQRMRECIDDAAQIDRRAGFASQLGPSLYQGVSLMLIVGALGVVWSAGLTGLGSFGGILLIVLRSLSYGQAAQGQIQALHANAAYVEMLEGERERFRESSDERAGRPLSRIGELRFDDVSFEYVAGQPVLTDISFAVPHGEVIGIVGPSGAGKSTLVQLVLRLRRPTTGRILADGVDIHEFARSDWFKRVSFVPQDARLFSGTIAENIAFYRDDVDPEAVERAARAANLHDEILRMPDGYDQWVGEGGMRLSGGQRQRLCIARALVESPDVLVLDEPTSALDVKSEALIRETVAGLTPRTTVFVIAHRLSTLDVCDRIMVIHDGRLQGFGTSSYLEANDPFYQEALVISGLR